MLGTGFELKQHTLFLPLAMPSFPIIPSASAISFSQFQTKNNVVGKEATKTAQLVLIRDATPSLTWKGNLPFFNFPHPPLNLISTLLLQAL
nr:hypothetical protein CFP56_74993 [Quercus suber]POE88980.1 hypothetical protein CFP56_39820 [Quercus suber]